MHIRRVHNKILSYEDHGNTDKGLWCFADGGRGIMARGLIGYDLPSENEPGISQKRKTDRNTMRKRIWTHFKTDPHSEQLQDSLWLVSDCDEKQMHGLLNDWGEEYRRMKDQPTFFFVHLPANINIIWIGKKKIRATRRSKK